LEYLRGGELAVLAAQGGKKEKGESTHRGRPVNDRKKRKDGKVRRRAKKRIVWNPGPPRGKGKARDPPVTT